MTNTRQGRYQPDPDDIRIRFDDFGLSDESRSIVLALDALAPAERAEIAGDRQITSPRARAVVKRIGALTGDEWSTLARFITAVWTARWEW
jgi:hypothetical protein